MDTSNWADEPARDYEIALSIGGARRQQSVALTTFSDRPPGIGERKRYVDVNGVTVRISWEPLQGDDAYDSDFDDEPSSQVDEEA
jgi:hypothetical protein